MKIKKKIKNPILKKYKTQDIEKIFEYSEKYSISILDEKSLNIIKKYSPLIEIGGGRGYNAYLLKQNGVKIKPFDKNIEKNIKYWFPVKKGTYTKIRDYSSYNLLISWPPSDNEMGFKSLQYFTKHSNAKYFIYIGEYRSQKELSIKQYITGTNNFFNYLDRHFTKIKSFKLLNWEITNTVLSIYKKKL